MIAPRVVNGQAHAGHPSVGKLLRSSSLCTATLIGSRTVLTAAHCVRDDGQTWHSFVADGVTYSVSKVIPHPEYSDTTYVNDIALALLAASPPIVPSPIAKLPPKVGQELTIVGFGRTKESGPSDSGIKRLAKNTVSSVAATRITIWGSSEGKGNICNGDSGGPSFAMIAGEELQVGVHSVKFSSCGVGGADTRVDAFLPWIEQAAAGDVAIGPQPQPDPDPKPDPSDPGDPDPDPKPDPSDPGDPEPDPKPDPKPEPPAPDADGDGVPDAQDLCSHTPQGNKVWAIGSTYPGCAAGQYQDKHDTDRDGIPNSQDGCSGTPIGAAVWTSGYWKGCAGGQQRDSW